MTSIQNSTKGPTKLTKRNEPAINNEANFQDTGYDNSKKEISENEGTFSIFVKRCAQYLLSFVGGPKAEFVENMGAPKQATNELDRTLVILEQVQQEYEAANEQKHPTEGLIKHYEDETNSLSGLSPSRGGLNSNSIRQSAGHESGGSKDTQVELTRLEALALLGLHPGERRMGRD